MDEAENRMMQRRFDREREARRFGIEPDYKAEERETLAAFFGLCLIFGTLAAVRWAIDAAPAAYAWLIGELPVTYSHKTPLAYVLAALLTIMLGWIVFRLRNVRRRCYEYPPIELGLSLALAGAAVKQGIDPLLSFVALLAAARVAADSFKNFKEFREEEAKRVEAARAKAAAEWAEANKPK